MQVYPTPKPVPIPAFFDLPSLPVDKSLGDPPTLYFLRLDENLLMAPGRYTGTFPMAFLSDARATLFVSKNARKLSRLGKLPSPMLLPATSRELGNAGAIWLDGHSSTLPGQQVWRGVVKLGTHLAQVLAAIERSEQDISDLSDQGCTFTGGRQ